MVATRTRPVILIAAVASLGVAAGTPLKAVSAPPPGVTKSQAPGRAPAGGPTRLTAAQYRAITARYAGDVIALRYVRGTMTRVNELARINTNLPSGFFAHLAVRLIRRRLDAMRPLPRTREMRRIHIEVVTPGVVAGPRGDEPRAQGARLGQRALQQPVR